MAAWDHFNDFGKYEGRIWHSALCWARCQAENVPFDWMDTQADGILADQEQFRRHPGQFDGSGHASDLTGSD
eukprot:SAG31_NODE_19444_length_602_cov_0.584493_1_plen_71_part_10